LKKINFEKIMIYKDEILTPFVSEEEEGGGEKETPEETPEGETSEETPAE